MCLKGGPRCYTHAKTESEDAYKKADALQASVRKTNDKLAIAARKRDKYKGDDPEMAASLKDKSDNLERESNRQHALFLEQLKVADKKRKEADATSGGIAEMKAKRDELMAKGDSADGLQYLIAQAEDKYAYDLEQHDKREGTVDGRKPSTHGTKDGISKFSQEIFSKEAKLKAFNEQVQAEGSTPALEKKIKAATARVETLRKQREHAYKTMEHIRKGYIPDPEKIKAAEDKATKLRQQAQESFDRSDTDGFMSQWASNTMANHHDMVAELERNGGKAEFNALFDSNGNMVPAKMVEVPDRYNAGRTNTAWAVLSDPDDVDSPIKEWVNTSKSTNPATAEAYLSRKGYTMGKVLAPAYVTERGNTAVNVRSLFVRKDRGFSKDAEVVTKNFYPTLIADEKQRAIGFEIQHAEQEKYRQEVAAQVKASKGQS